MQRLPLGGRPCVKTGTSLTNSSLHEWSFQVSKLEVIRPYFVGICPYIGFAYIYMVIRYLLFRSLKWPLIEGIAPSWVVVPEKNTDSTQRAALKFIQ